MEPVAPSPSTYELVAAEYYDPQLHPTCADFRSTDHVLLDRLELLPGRIGELGAGRSAIAERGLDPGCTLLLFDGSTEMLKTNRRSVVGTVADAARLPVRQGSLDAVVALLADPFNTPLLWNEIARVLRPDGQFVFSTPSWHWSSRYRLGVGDGQHDAVFELVNGERVALPSFILTPEEQTLMIEAHGLAVESVSHVSRKEIEPIRSSKLSWLGADDPVVSCFVGRLRCG